MTSRNHIQNFVDPVCGMQVEPSTAAAHILHEGRTVYFCATSCQRTFEANPAQFQKPKRKGIWRRYLDRLNKSTGGKPPSCCQ